MLKELYYEKYLTKIENVDDNYWRNLEESYLEESHGHLNLVKPQTAYEKKIKMQHFHNIYQGQKESLDAWLNYLLSPDASYLPMWAKVWAFQGMLNIGTLNENKDAHLKRDKNTVNPFIEINSEVLGKSVTYLEQRFNNQQFKDEEIKKLVDSESFAKIYGSLLLKVKAIKTNGIEGKWVKYNEGDEKEAERLYNDLQGYNTGWCTAGSIKTAIEQVCGGSSYLGGDFYVYYSKDENEEYKIPRIAIRMDKAKIGEVRGIAKNQNIESEMEEILQEKLKEFPDAPKYYKRVSDMKELTKIYKKWQVNEELTVDELRFLYEIDEKIEGFGYQRDPRIEEIELKRNVIKDLSIVLNCSQEKIGIEPETIDNKDIYYYLGNLNLKNRDNVKDLKLPQYVSGDLDLSGLTSIEGLALPEIVNGDLDLSGLTSVEGLVLPKSIGGSLYLNGLMSAEGLVLPKSIGRSLYLDGLMSAEGLVLPEGISGDLGLSSLTSAEGLVLPKSIGESLYLNGLMSAEGLVLPESIGRSLHLNDLMSAEDLVLPKSIGGSLYLNGLMSAKGLLLPECINGDLSLDGLMSAEGLVLPKSVRGSLSLDGLMSVEGLVLPENIGKSLYLDSLTVEDLLNLDFGNIKFDMIYLHDYFNDYLGFMEIWQSKRKKKNIQLIDDFQDVVNCNMKRGILNICYVLLPAFLLLMGIVIAFIIYY